MPEKTTGRVLHAGEFQVLTGPVAYAYLEEADSEAILAALFPEETQ